MSDATGPVGQNLPVRLTLLQNQVIHLPQLRDSMLPPPFLDKQRNILYRMTSYGLVLSSFSDNSNFHCFSNNDLRFCECKDTTIFSIKQIF